jgi:hypothetical protein
MLKVSFAVCTALLAAGLYNFASLPDVATLRAELGDEPRQQSVVRAAFTKAAGGVTYTIEPSHRYEIYGLVVSKHNADTWWDYVHAATKDNLNVTDLCVVWGSNALGGAYRNLSFSSGQWTCNWQTSSDEAWRAFDANKISNNHILTDDARLARKLRNVRIGDQIHITGQLASYKHQSGLNFSRGTSTVRTDTGNGACETIFADDVNIIRAAPAFWRNLTWAAALGMLLSMLLGLFAPHRARPH